MSDFKVPADLRYTSEHEWVRLDGDVLTVGITDYAQDALGDITFLELPDEGRELAAGETFGVVESVKTFSDLFAPVAGTVVEVNNEAIEDPAGMNIDAYDVWLIKIRVASVADIDALLDATAYKTHVDSVS
jgi:glycine cleavage system H protein